MFEHLNNTKSALNVKGRRDRVERLVKYLCVQKGRSHIIGNKSHETTFVIQIGILDHSANGLFPILNTVLVNFSDPTFSN